MQSASNVAVAAVPPLPPKVEVRVEEPTHMIALWENVFFSMWSTAPTEAQMRRILDVQRPMWAKYPKGVVPLSYIAKMGMTQLNMSSDVRKVIDEVSREADQHALAQVHLVVGTGFFTSMVRTMIAGLHLLRAPSFPVKVTDNEDDAIAFMKPYTPAGVDVVTRALIARYRAGLPS